MARLVLDRQEQARIARARGRIEEVGLSQTWVAEEIGRARPHVSGLLNGKLWSPGTMQLIEELLDRLESEVARGAEVEESA